MGCNSSKSTGTTDTTSPADKDQHNDAEHENAAEHHAEGTTGEQPAETGGD